MPRSGEKHSTASRVFPYTSFVLYRFLRALQQNRAQSRLLYLLNKTKQFHWLLCVAKNCDWFRKITPLSNLARASLLMKTYSERRIELRTLQILKKMLEKSSQFLSSEQPCEPKSLHVNVLNIARVEKISSENFCLRSTLLPRGHQCVNSYF